MLLDVSKEKVFTCVFLKEPKLDIHFSTDFSARIVELIDQGNVQVVIDLSMVQFIDSSGLGALFAVHKAVEKVSGRLVLCGLQEKVLSIFKTTLMDKVFELSSSVDEVLER